MAHFDSVEVEIVKLTHYCLSDSHPRGRHKARVFRSQLNIGSDEAEILQAALYAAVEARREDIQSARLDEFGQRYVLDFGFSNGPLTATIRSTWIVLSGQGVIRLTSCYVL